MQELLIVLLASLVSILLGLYIINIIGFLNGP